MNDLDRQLITAHDAGDTNALIRLYQMAADHAATVDAACFYLTHAYVFALEAGHADTAQIKARLVAEGREPG